MPEILQGIVRGTSRSSGRATGDAGFTSVDSPFGVDNVAFLQAYCNSPTLSMLRSLSCSRNKLNHTCRVSFACRRCLVQELLHVVLLFRHERVDIGEVPPDIEDALLCLSACAK